jgi:hypothetical protein
VRRATHALTKMAVGRWRPNSIFEILECGQAKAAASCLPFSPASSLSRRSRAPNSSRAR